MPGQATVIIKDNQWNVWVASTPTELTTGLSGRESIPAGTGMLFILPAKQPVTVDTSKMMFPIDIIFISEAVTFAPDGINLVVDVASNIQPGYLVSEETPCDMFLEVNAGEAAGVETGDTVSITTIQQPGFDLSQIISFAMPLVVLGFVCTLAGGVMTGVMGSSSSPKRGELPQAEKVTVKCPLCKKEIEIPEYDRVSRSEALKKHLEKEHGGHHSMWLTPEQRKALEEKYGAVALRWAEEATRPGDMKGVEAAAEYYYKRLKEVFGLGHLSPELSEEQLKRLREVLGLPEDVAEVLKIHRETGYIP